jgi:hypothetical protein
MKKQKMTLLITICVIAALSGGLKSYYAIRNHKYENKINELNTKGKMDFRIESKTFHAKVFYGYVGFGPVDRKPECAKKFSSAHIVR